ncbi:hypothetical protein MUK42_04616 [Musa troglodytarum]|uniref:Uncharacterized protein n=1 Tax=Musa troglodytarum TaxID=320322 RepID=A0A9E7GQA3_9LILI|nr:hypothetical protein MUK42_04616 [Musa troglodytarum]
MLPFKHAILRLPKLPPTSPGSCGVANCMNISQCITTSLPKTLIIRQSKNIKIHPVSISIHSVLLLLPSTGEELSSAQWAGDMPDVHPLIYAGPVEGMGAVAELPDLVSGLQGAQADGADGLAPVEPSLPEAGEPDDGKTGLDDGGGEGKGKRGGGGDEVGQRQGVEEVVFVGRGEAEVEEGHGNGELDAVDEVDDESDGAREDDGVADGGETHGVSRSGRREVVMEVKESEV